MYLVISIGPIVSAKCHVPGSNGGALGLFGGRARANGGVQPRRGGRWRESKRCLTDPPISSPFELFGCWQRSEAEVFLEVLPAAYGVVWKGGCRTRQGNIVVTLSLLGQGWGPPE
jgi:hypothetical protein